MSRNWRIFFLVEGSLLIGMLYSIFKNVPLLICAGIAIAVIFIGVEKKRTQDESSNIAIILGVSLLVFVLLSTTYFWIGLVFCFLFLFSKKEYFFSKKEPKIKKAPWNKKEIMVVETTASSQKNGKKFKRQWIGNQRIGDSIYEWDDINIIILAGDTIVDLGNTLLPKDDNIVLIRKGFGKTRILVPIGTGVMLEHTALNGEVRFESQHFELHNESVKLYTNNYDESNRRLKILTSVFLGDVEVIFV